MVSEEHDCNKCLNLDTTLCESCEWNIPMLADNFTPKDSTNE